MTKSRIGSEQKVLEPLKNSIKVNPLYNSLLEAIPEIYRVNCPSLSKFKESCSFKLFRIAPKRTLSISVTGRKCNLNCSHCESHYLNGMTPLTSIDKVDFSQYDSVLISGGSDTTGKVPIAENFAQLSNLPAHLSLNIHPGYQPAEAFLRFKNPKNLISFDLPGSDEVISKVFHLPYSYLDYQKLFLDFQKHFVTIPHITIGLNFGLNSGEEKSIDFLSKTSPEMLVFIVLRPTSQTSMANCPTPSIERILELLKYAKSKLSCPIQLGCMRPSGEPRKIIDIVSWMSGVDKIVMPDHRLIKTLEKFNIPIIQTNECCAFNRANNE